MNRRKRKRNNLRLSIAVIGEGETEWFYFDHYKKCEKPRFLLKPDKPKHASDIKSIESKIHSLLDEYYDIIYCIIDLDRVVTNSREEKKYNNLKSKFKSENRVHFIENMPCFEIWFLLHFCYTGRTFYTYRELLPELLKYIPDYEKTKKYYQRKNLYQELLHKLKTAIDNSEQLCNCKDSQSKSEIYRIIVKLNEVQKGSDKSSR